MKKREQLGDSKFFWPLIDRMASWHLSEELSEYLRWHFRDRLDDSFYYMIYIYLRDYNKANVNFVVINHIGEEFND